MVGERLRDAFDHKNIVRRLEDRSAGGVHEARNAPGNFLRDNITAFENRNIGEGRIVGLAGGSVAQAIYTYIPIPGGAEVEVTEVEDTENGARYVVDVDAVTENIARVRAFFDTSIGLASYLVDYLDVNNVEVVNTRFVRDTYRIELVIEE